MRTSPLAVTGTTVAAPGWRTMSRSMLRPLGRRTVSTLTWMTLPGCTGRLARSLGSGMGSCNPTRRLSATQSVQRGAMRQGGDDDRLALKEFVQARLHLGVRIVQLGQAHEQAAVAGLR